VNISKTDQEFLRVATSAFPIGLTAVMLPDLEFDQQLALCKELGLTHYSIRPRIIPEDQKDKPPGNWGRHLFDLTPRRLVEEAAQIRQKLTDAGMVPFGTVPTARIDQTDEELIEHFKGAQLVGAGRVRVAPLPYPNEFFDYKAELKKTIEGFKRVVKLAKPFGQKIVIETHCRSMATSPGLALNICQEFDPSELGVIFDIANFNIEGGLAPHLAVSVLNKYIDHVHIGGSKRISSNSDAQGYDVPSMRMCAMTESHLYLPAWVKALDQAGLHVPLLIEDYTPAMSGEARLRRSAADLKRIVENL
jgi:sugar phosphate isomerase/epimerase